MSQIKYIKNKDIDFILWDKCITRSQNGDVFGYSWYLDSIYSKWNAIVIDDYKAVFPVPVYRIAGIKRIIKPVFLSKLNLYTSKNINPEITSGLLKYLPVKFYNFFSDIKSLSDFPSKLSEKKSYRLDLISTYNSVQKTYSSFFKEQLEIAKKIRVLSSLSLRKNNGEIYGAFNEKNRLTAAVLFISSHYKTNIIVAYQTKEAQKKKALYGLIDHYLKTHSEKAVTLDFFGLSLMPDEFYKGLGAKKYPYYNIRKRFLF